MTEDEAKTKWCPFARLVTTPQGRTGVIANSAAGYNRYSGDAERVADASPCIASACMAWREVHSSVGPQRVHPNVLGEAWIGWTITDDTPDARGYVEISPPGHGVTHGRCGLAGE